MNLTNQSHLEIELWGFELPGVLRNLIKLPTRDILLTLLSILSSYKAVVLTYSSCMKLMHVAKKRMVESSDMRFTVSWNSSLLSLSLSVSAA